jgi:hypothetical protein
MKICRTICQTFIQEMKTPYVHRAPKITVPYDRTRFELGMHTVGRFQEAYQ